MGKRYKNYCPQYWIKQHPFCCCWCFFKTLSNKKSLEHSNICKQRKKEGKCSFCGDPNKALKETGKNVCWACYYRYKY